MIARAARPRCPPCGPGVRRAVRKVPCMREVKGNFDAIGAEAKDGSRSSTPAPGRTAAYWKTTSSTYNVVADPDGNRLPEMVNPCELGSLAANESGTVQET